MSNDVAASMCVTCSEEGVVRIGGWVMHGIAYCDDHVPAYPVLNDGDVVGWEIVAW